MNEDAFNKLTLRKVNDQVFEVRTDLDAHVGNLKRIGAVWKFKAVGYESTGEVVPGGGPFTDRHNTVFDGPDEAVVSAALLMR
jgi:hypothetical protein